MQYTYEILYYTLETAIRHSGRVGPLAVVDRMRRSGCDVSMYRVRKAFKEMRASNMLAFWGNHYTLEVGGLLGAIGQAIRYAENAKAEGKIA